MFEFQYVSAKSLADAAAALAANPEAKLLAGGMTLLPTLKQRLARPTHLIDIGGLTELRGIAVEGGRLAVGAATKHFEVAASPVIKEVLPALAYLASEIADPQVRNRGTIGGSLANNDPAADYPAAVLALNAIVRTNQRDIEADEFFQGMFTTALTEGEIITKVLFEIPTRAAYSKFSHPASGYAMAGAFIAQTAAGVRVAVTGAAPSVFRWSAAEAALAKNLSVEALSSLALDAAKMNEDFHATREYRANLAKVMTKRALSSLLNGNASP